MNNEAENRQENYSISDRMATAVVEEHSCVTPNCGEKAKLRCPNCVKLGLHDGSYFCSQDCFKSYWQEHKKLHGQASMSFPNSSQKITFGFLETNESAASYNPYPSFRYTGKLRPYPQVRRDFSRMLKENDFY